MRLYTMNLDIAYDEKVIVKNLSVTIPDKKITTIIGPNGCGKSTLLKAMTRLIPYKEGQVILDGKEIHKENTKELAKKLAILPQSPDHPSGLTVYELVSYGRFPYQAGFGRLTKQDKEIIDWALDATGLLELKYRPVDSLSGGQRQRAWIALALAQDTDIIFLDEPTTYLDIAHQLEVLELLERLNREEDRTIVMVLHDLNHAARFAHFIIAMKDGRIVKTGTSEEVIDRNVLREIFQIEAIVGKDPLTKKPLCYTYNLIK
ncbi:MAG: ABC transporter ATP-binding protein [Bacilli bacterium]|nr:ABC transporter ATP-binding protein [Bacilli bacterium]